MAKYIEREDAREKLCSMCRWEGTAMCSECEHPIDDIPAADVRPVVHGEWEFEYENLDEQIEYCCSVCDWIGLNANEYNYCPNCGSNMDGDGNA